MTNTAPSRQTHAIAATTDQPMISRDSSVSLVEQIVRVLAARIDDRLLRRGTRMPSIRQFAEQHGVSRFTVIEAYDRLVAGGHLESRRGSGFFVRERAPLPSSAPPAADAANNQLDVVWLVRNMFRQLPPQKMPGSGLLPADWLDAELVGNGLRAVSRQNPALLLQYGSPQGFLPLRQQLQLKLAQLEIQATPEQIVTTSGVTQALDLVARQFLRPGDTVFVDDPAWFLMFGSFAALGARVIGIPRAPDGPDVAKLAELAALHRPKLLVINSVLHNPTSGSLSSAKAFQILKIAEQYDFHIAEDDIYCDLHPGSVVQPATRIAALDQLQRVIYLGGFSKTLAANLRTGFMVAAPALAQALADRKILSSLTTSEIGERVLYKVLSEGHYRKHVERLRSKLDRARERSLRQLERIGLDAVGNPAAGMFVWVDTGRDTNRLTEQAMTEGWLLAPGSLFSPHQLPSPRMRLNIAAMSDPGIWRFLEESLGKS